MKTNHKKKPTAKKKVIKGWAILSEEREGKIALGVMDCSFKIFPAEECAKLDSLIIRNRVNSIVPCTIHYVLPTKPKKQ